LLVSLNVFSLHYFFAKLEANISAIVIVALAVHYC